MKSRSRAGVEAIAVICLSLGSGSPAYPQTRTPGPGAVGKGAIVTARASGTFEVKLTPQASDDKAEIPLGRMSIDKQFHGDLEGTSKGEMLTAGAVAKGSAGYVAVERVSGTLNGRTGSFVLQHSGTMTRGALQLSVTVVPDSGTGQLVGLAGKMAIRMTDGKHFYDFDYTISENP